MQLPFVSRRAYLLLETSLERAIRERDAQQDRADRLAEQLVNRFGFEPVSAPVRAELKEYTEELKKYEDSLQLEDTSSGMISDDVLAMAQEFGSKVPS